jgi:hypothetical protein
MGKPLNFFFRCTLISVIDYLVIALLNCPDSFVHALCILQLTHSAPVPIFLLLHSIAHYTRLVITVPSPTLSLTKPHSLNKTYFEPSPWLYSFEYTPSVDRL